MFRRFFPNRTKRLWTAAVTILIAATDVQNGNARSIFGRINNAPAFFGWQDNLEHIGTLGADNGGELGARISGSRGRRHMSPSRLVSQ